MKPKPTDAKKVLEMLYGAPKPAVSRLDMGFKDVTKRMPELQQAARLYEQGKITREQYYAIVDQLKPVTPYEFIPKPATAEEALAALSKDKVKDFGRTDVLTPGETILSRLDIPAYSKKGTWVTSQHRLKPPADEPKTIYTPTMMLEGETKMLPGTKAARKVAKGEYDKSSFATIRGAYKPGSDEEAVERAIEALRSKDYAQIGYDPERRGFFYDRRTMEPIIGTEEGIIQIGPLVLGKKPIRGKPEDFEYKDGGAVHMQDGGDPTQMFNFNPMAAKAAKQKQMRESTPETPLGALSRGFASGLFGNIEDPVPYTGSIMEGSPQRQQSQANLREIGRNVGALTDIGGMVTPFVKPATQAITRGATALGRTGLEQVDRAMFGEGPLGNALSMVAPLNVNAPVSRLGFYNPIEETATTLQRKQGPGQAFLNEFTRAGISKQRLEEAGLAQKLAATPNVTREEVQAMTKGTMPDVEEVVLSRSVVPPYMKGFADLHMPDLNVNDYRQINQLRKLADERYQKALAENDLDAAEFAMKAEEDINKFSRTHSYGTKPGERLTEYHEYQEPGGKNYREVLLKVPSSEKYDDNFRSSHWSDPNVISHIRMNDRVDADNKNVLFIEELQSDWAQEGRKKGFAPKNFDQQIKEGIKRLEGLRDQLAAIKSKLDQPGLAPDERNILMEEYGTLTNKQAEEIDWGNNLIDAKNSGIPEGQFVKNTNEWVDLSLKNIIRRAVDEGYDRVAFIDGYKSFLRFPQGADGESTEAGMRKFYDEIIPGRLKALVGKDNVRTIPGITQQRPLDVSLQGDRYYVVDADTDIAIPDHPGFRSLERAEQYLDELYSKSKSMDQIGFDITPEIREKFSKPIPYKEGGAVYAAGGAVSMQDGGSPLDQFYQPANPMARRAAQQELMRQEIARRRAEELARQQTPLDTSLPGPSPTRPGLPSMADLKGAFERRVMPVISEAKQTAMTGGILGDLARAYGEASVPVNQAMATALGRPFEQERPPEAPPEMTVPTAFERRGDIFQQLAGQAIGDPANLLDPGILRGLEAGARAVKPSVMRGLEAGTQAVRPFAKTAAEMVEEMAMKGVPGTDAMQLRMGILPETPKLPEAPASAAEAQSFTGRIKNDAELIAARGQVPASIERAETALNSGQRVFKLDENGNQVQVMDAAELMDVDPKSLRVVNISPEEFQAVNLAAKRNPEAQRSMFDQIESLHKDFAPEEGWTPLNIIKGEVKLDKRGKPVINRQTGLPMTEVEVAKIPYAFHTPPEGVPKEAWEDMLAARITDEVDQVLRRAQAGDQEAINILKEAAWYRAMRDRLRGEFGGIGDVFADVLGTTSAQTGVEQNFDNAVEILRRFARGDYDKELLAYDKRLRSNETVDGVTLTRMFRNNEFPLITKAGGQLFNANSPASMGALLDMFRAIKAGDSPKTPNFTGNLIGLTNEATIDVWAARMLRRMADLPRIPPPAEKGVAGLHKVGSTLYQPNVSGEFGFGQDVFRKAAQELNNAGLLKAYDPAIGDVGPDDLQAIAWFIEKELWTKNKWTSKAGEGGSLDYEMSFAGAPESEKIKSLRKEVGKEFSPKQFPQRKTESDKEYAKRLEQERMAFEKDKTNKAEQLKNLRADVERYRLGVSGERPNKPMSDYGQAELASEFDDVVRDDPSVVTYNLTSTLGSFMGDTERALNAEFITRSDFNPLPLERRLVEQGKYYDQDAVFMSKAVPIDAPNARPGVEIYFKQKLSPADMALVTEKLRSYGVDGFTYISDMRMENRPNLRVTTQAMQNKTFRPFAEDLRPEPGSSGITFQYIPEFDDEFDAANAAAIMQQRREIYMQIIEDMANSGNVSDARLTHFDTKVFFRGDYDDYLARAIGDSYQAPRREQQSGSISEESNTRGKNQQKLQRAVSDRVREEASSQAVKKPGGKKPLAKAAGGRVHVSNNLDTMLLELMRNKRYG